MSTKPHALAILRGMQRLQEMRGDIDSLFEMLLDEKGEATKCKECPDEMRFKVYETEEKPVYITFYFEKSLLPDTELWHIRVKIDTVIGGEFKAERLSDETVVKLHGQLDSLVEDYLGRFPDKKAHFEFLAELNS